MQDTAVRHEVQAVESALADLEGLPDGAARTAALGAVEGLLRLYGEGLRRVVERLALAPVVAEQLADDELVGHLLLLHGLHPDTLEERVARALEDVRPYMGSHGGGVELVGIADGVARVRLEGTCSGCAASTATLKLAIEDAVLRAAPEVNAVEAVEPAAAGLAPPPLDGCLPMAPATPTELPVIPSAPATNGGAA
jgi:Fe-S cluster biogenesis protein NfuA